MNHITEIERCDAIEATHWKEKWMDASKQLSRLQSEVNRYARAIKEYESARRFLELSGDDPLSYSDVPSDG